MNILILSDLHNEFSLLQKPSAKADLIILAGDIWLGDKGVRWARETWPYTPIIFIAGNHEFYKSFYEVSRDAIETVAFNLGVHYLENDQFVFAGVRFLGCTLWTDFRLFGDEMQSKCMKEAGFDMNDYRVILSESDDIMFSPAHSLKIHEDSLSWLKQKLDEPFNGKTVVVTHHLPSMLSVAPKYKENILSAAYASNLDYLFGKMDLWIHGHTHDSVDYVQNGTRVVANPRGYCRFEGGEENYDFNPNLIVEV